MEIDQIHQQFLADAAHETGRVPARSRIEPRRVHSHVTGRNAFATPVANLIRGELLHGSPAEGLPLPLGREEFQLFALFIGQ